MTGRRNNYDVTNRVETTDPREIRQEIGRIFQKLYPGSSDAAIGRAVADAARLFRGEYPGYSGCETAYHDLQHTLDVTLAMARIMAGYIGQGHGPAIDADLFSFGIAAALFHDAGYIRRAGDHRHVHGAEYTKIHVSRGGRFLRKYLPTIGLAYFGTVPPELLEIRFTLPPGYTAQTAPTFRLPPGWYAVSVNYVMGRPHVIHQPDGGSHGVGLDEFGYFREFEPVARLGYSIDVYHVK